MANAPLNAARCLEHSKCEDRVLLLRPVGGKAKKLVATVLREGLSAP
jgi:hypothetical protein